MKKNLYALKLAGLLKEQAGPPMGNGPEMGSGPEMGGGGDQGGGEDPAALLDQAIDLLNKVKDALGGGAGAEPPPDQGAGAPPQGM